MQTRLSCAVFAVLSSGQSLPYMHQKRLTYLAFSPVESLPYYDPPDIAKPPKDAHGWWAANVTEDELSDGQIAERAVTTLNALGRGGGE